MYSDVDNKAYKGKKWNDLIKELQKQEEGSLAMIAVDENALKACREINKAQADAETNEPEVGGTNKKYQQLLGSQQKTGDVQEFTYTKWNLGGQELVLLNLLQEYEKFMTPPVADANTGTIPEPKKPAILDAHTQKMGVAFSAHKKTENIVQFLFVKQAGNKIE